MSLSGPTTRVSLNRTVTRPDFGYKYPRSDHGLQSHDWTVTPSVLWILMYPDESTPNQTSDLIRTSDSEVLDRTVTRQDLRYRSSQPDYLS